MQKIYKISIASVQAGTKKIKAVRIGRRLIVRLRGRMAAQPP